MTREFRPWISLYRGALIAAALGASVAYASDPGSGHDDDIEAPSGDSGSDHSGRGGDESSGSDRDSSGRGWDDSSGDNSGSSNDGDRADDGGDTFGGGDNSGSGSDSDGDQSDDGGDNSGSGDSGGDGGDQFDDGDDNSGSGNSDDGDEQSGGSESDNSGTSSAGAQDSGHLAQVAASEAALSQATQHAIVVERDEHGSERVAGEALFVGNANELNAARAAGFEVLSERALTSSDGAIARLHVPDGMSIDSAVNALHTVAPHALVTSNNIYRGSEASVRLGRLTPRPHQTNFVGVLGIIDTGVDVPSLAPSALLSQRSFGGNAPIARQHGSLVAALAIEEGMRVHVADVFGSSADGAQAASADSIAAALDWMITNRVPVINISIEGPNNAVLAALVNRAVRNGHVIVAAAGNGGPLARPAFPAAFEGSVAVTAIDGDDRPYMRANRGAYISFAAPGVDLDVRTGDGAVLVSGTSFAAPLVAAKIAERLHQPSPANARNVLAALQDQAVDLGAPGRDPIFGWGALRD
jgi:hypothetical protein